MNGLDNKYELKMNKIVFCEIDIDYLKSLYEFDNEVSYNQNYKKHIKAHLGILTSIQNNTFIIPLTSPKEKHLKISNNSNQIEKMFDQDNNSLGVLLIQKIIPVSEILIKRINLEKDKKYGNLILKQLNYIKKNKARILKKVNTHYDKVMNNKKIKFSTNLPADINFLKNYLK